MATATKKKTPTVSVTIGMFDLGGGEPVLRIIRDGIAIDKWKTLARRDYNPRGSTPLRDATAQFIAHLDNLKAPGTVVIGCLADESGSMGGNEESVVAGINEFVAGMADVEVDPDTDGKVLAVILTDGMENASREVNQQDLQKMIAQRESEDWTFIYLGANQDAWAVGQGVGVAAATSSLYNYESSPVGTQSAFRAATHDSSEWLSKNSQRLASKVAAGGQTLASVSESGEVNGAAKPTTGSKYDIQSAIDKAKGEDA